MKKCHNCGTQLDDKTVFCGECGTKQMPKSKKEMKLSEKKYELQLGDLVVIIPDTPMMTITDMDESVFNGIYFLQGEGFKTSEYFPIYCIREVNGVPVKIIDDCQYKKYEEQ